MINQIYKLTGKLAQAERCLETQKDYFTGIIEELTEVTRQVEEAYRQLKRDSAARFKTLAANAKRLLTEQTALYRR